MEIFASSCATQLTEFIARSRFPDRRQKPFAAKAELPKITTRDSFSPVPWVAATASDTGPFRSLPGVYATLAPSLTSSVSPQAREPVLASSTTVHPAGAGSVFQTLRAKGKIPASAKGELRGAVMGWSA